MIDLVVIVLVVTGGFEVLSNFNDVVVNSGIYSCIGPVHVQDPRNSHPSSVLKHLVVLTPP